MYEEEEEEHTTQKITIPKYKILLSDLEVEKKDQNPSDNMLSLGDRSEKLDRTQKKEEKNLLEKILELATLSLENSSLDKEIATKLKRKLDEDSDLNHPSVTHNEKKMDEHGVWQVIVGRSYVASVTFDAKYLIMNIIDIVEDNNISNFE